MAATLLSGGITARRGGRRFLGGGARVRCGALALVLPILLGAGVLAWADSDNAGGVASSAPRVAAAPGRLVPSCSSPSFGPAIDFTPGASPTAVAVADFNRDGNPDLAVANYGSDNVSVLLGNGKGEFGTATNLATGDGTASVAAGDFNGDGNPDLVAANRTSNDVSVLLGDGNGGFGPATNFQEGNSPRYVSVGDFNRDGVLDLVISKQTTVNVSVRLGVGDGSFAPGVLFRVGTAPGASAVADFNGDGNQDVAVVNAYSNNISVLLGDGTGGFGTANNIPAVDFPVSIAVGDFNRDGHLDLSVVHSANDASVFLGDGSGGFSDAGIYQLIVANALAVADVNRDGILDLLVTTENTRMAVLLGNGSGGFGSATYFPLGHTPEALAVGDFNRDGAPDVVAANPWNISSISVLLNACTTVEATATPTSTAPGPTTTPTNTPTDTRTNTPTDTATAALPTATNTVVPSDTAVPTLTPVPATHTPAPANTLAPTMTFTPCAIGFIDVQPGDYFYMAVGNLACLGAISGYEDGTFRPFNNTTRGQLCKIVVVAEGWTIDTSDGPHFTDVPTSNPFYNYVETAYHREIISGYDDRSFHWGNYVTRAQLCKIVVVAREWAIDTSGGPHFLDVPATDAFYGYIETAYHRGVISGYVDQTFRSSSNATRGQIAKIVRLAISSL